MVTKDFSRMFVTGSCIISHGVGQDHSQNIMSLVDRDTRLPSLFWITKRSEEELWKSCNQV
jgi:hypothetical protein